MQVYAATLFENDPIGRGGGGGWFQAGTDESFSFGA